MLRQRIKDSCRTGLKKVLLVPPDMSRAHSRGGEIAALYYEFYTQMGTEVHILPALGSHFPMTRAEQVAFFGNIPEEKFLLSEYIFPSIV